MVLPCEHSILNDKYLNFVDIILIDSSLSQMKEELHQLHNNVKSLEAQEEKFTENEEMYEKKVRDLEDKLKVVSCS